MKLIVKSPVWDDLREIGLKIAAGNPEAADRFYTTAQDAYDLLTRHPGLGRLRSFSLVGLRSWLMPDFANYLVFYLPTTTEVQILAVLDGRRDLPPVIKDRLK